MALSLADLEWIRRLPLQPSPEDQGTLRALRRGVTSADEVRLLDSLLAPIGRANAQGQERTDLERRLAVLDDRLSDEGQDKARTAARRGALRIVDHKATAARRNPLQSDQETAVAAALAGAKERHREMERERVEIKGRLREIHKAERQAARTSA